ncbi:PepSY domain-containing protein [Neisseriaceae bacterium TC5R-5]|nr:PepSY domain-containing protein [Neisseriaceae bacterium TC5R-5]
MKKLMVGTCFLLGLNSAVFANNNCDYDNILTMEQIHEKLQAAGYTRIRDIDLDDCLYEAEAKDKKGNNWELKIHSKTGKIISRNRDSFYD